MSEAPPPLARAPFPPPLNPPFCKLVVLVEPLYAIPYPPEYKNNFVVLFFNIMIPVE